MKVVCALFLLLIGDLIAPAQISLNKLERVELLGRPYVRLQDWAKAANFQIKSQSNSKDLCFTSASARLGLTVGSQKAEINGISVWLSMPIAQRNGSAFISLLDLRTMIQPVLFPPQLPAGTKIKTICLDPGHGGKDPGYEVSRKQEKVLTLLLAKELRGLLNKAGINVVLTRTTDSFVERPNRPEIAKRSRADLFVSLHYNSAGGTGIVARGVETYCLTPPRAQSTNARGDLDETRAVLGNLQDARNALLAYQIQKALVQKLSLEDRGVRRARWTVLQTATMPAILVECGFMSDPVEAGKIYDPAFRKRAAQAIVDGLMAYKRNVER